MTARRLAGVLPPSVTQRSSSSWAAGLGPGTEAAGCFAAMYPATSSPFSRRRNQLRLSVGSSTPTFARPARKSLQCIFADLARSRTPTRKKPSLLAMTRDAAQFSAAQSSHACRCAGVSAGRHAKKLLRATAPTARRSCVPVAIYRGRPVPDSSREVMQARHAPGQPGKPGTTALGSLATLARASRPWLSGARVTSKRSHKTQPKNNSATN